MNRRRILQPLFTGTVLALGFGIVWALTVVFVIRSVNEVMCEQQDYKSIVVQSDGTPLVQTVPPGHHHKETYHTLDGELASIDSASHSHRRAATLAVPGPTRGPWFSRPWSSRVQSFMDTGTYPPGLWYLVHDGRRHGSAHFVGYDSDTKMLIGYIGIGGFQEELPKLQERFPMDARMMGYGRGVLGERREYLDSYYSQGYMTMRLLVGESRYWNVYLVSEGRLLQIDLHERSVRTVLEVDGLCAAGRIYRATEAGANRSEVIDIALRTADQVLLLAPEGNRRESFTIPAALHGNKFTFYNLDTDQAMFHVTHAIERHAAIKHRFVWADRQGNVIREKSVAFENTSWLNQVDVTMGVAGVAVPATGIITTAMAVVWPLVLVDEGTSTSYPAAMAELLPICWPPLLAVNLLGVVLAIFCYRRQKRFAQARVWPWVVFVFLFGLPGMVGYLAHQRWPVREACPKCKQQAPRDRDACSACDEPFPQPEPKGIEVLV